MNDYQKLIDYLVEEKLKGADYTKIRNELKERNLDDATIHKIISEIDLIIVNEELNKNTIRKRKEIYYAGMIIAAIGLFVTYATYSGWINTGNSYLITHGPFFAGMMIMFYARTIRPKNAAKQITFKGRHIKH